MTGMPWLAALAAVALLIGLWLLGAGRSMRRRRGLGDGKTVALDNVTLASGRYGLVSKPDRLIKNGGAVIPEEWKSARTLRPWHTVQLGVDFLVIEDQMKLRPSHGFIVTGDGRRHRIENDDALRAWVLDLVGEIRRARADVRQAIPVNPKPGQCRPCGMRRQCARSQ